jgi:hypothetical protein
MASPLGSGYAPAAANRPFRRLKRCETPFPRGETHQRGPHFSMDSDYEHRHNEKKAAPR